MTNKKIKTDLCRILAASAAVLAVALLMVRITHTTMGSEAGYYPTVIILVVFVFIIRVAIAKTSPEYNNKSINSLGKTTAYFGAFAIATGSAVLFVNLSEATVPPISIGIGVLSVALVAVFVDILSDTYTAVFVASISALIALGIVTGDVVNSFSVVAFVALGTPAYVMIVVFTDGLLQSISDLIGNNKRN